MHSEIKANINWMPKNHSFSRIPLVPQTKMTPSEKLFESEMNTNYKCLKKTRFLPYVQLELIS